MLAMKVAAILLLSTTLVQAKPVEKREALFDPFALMVQKYISENDFKALCDLTKQMHTILTESKMEEDQKVIQKSLDQLKEATQHLEDFHCQVPEWIESYIVIVSIQAMTGIHLFLTVVHVVILFIFMYKSLD